MSSADKSPSGRSTPVWERTPDSLQAAKGGWLQEHRFAKSGEEAKRWQILEEYNARERMQLHGIDVRSPAATLGSAPAAVALPTGSGCAGSSSDLPLPPLHDTAGSLSGIGGLDCMDDRLQFDVSGDEPTGVTDGPHPENNGAALPAARRNPFFGSQHTATETAQVEHELELVGNQHIVDSDPELEEQDLEVTQPSTHAAIVVPTTLQNGWPD